MGDRARGEHHRPADRNYVFDDNSQALVLTRLVRELRSMPDVRATILHTLVEPTFFGATSSEYGFGVVRRQPGLEPKPAYCALAALSLSGYSCPSSVAAVKPIDALQDRRWEAQTLLQSAVDAARGYRAAAGSYSGLSVAALRSRAPGLSATAAVAGAAPGPAADPARIYVSVTGSGPPGGALQRLARRPQLLRVGAPPRVRRWRARSGGGDRPPGRPGRLSRRSAG